MTAISLSSKPTSVSQRWSPKTVAGFNGHDVMVVKVKGEFIWRSHPDTDNFFLVLKGCITIKLRDREVRLEQGEMCVVPRGVEHCPVARDETELLLIERAGMPNTGDPNTAAIRETI